MELVIRKLWRKVCDIRCRDIHTSGENALTLSQDWEFNKGTGRKSSGYPQAVDHIKLVTGNGYSLKIFKMTFSTANKDEAGNGPAQIDGFEPVLLGRHLFTVGENWYATTNRPTPQIAEEIVSPEKYIEGATKTVSVNTYELNTQARSKCLDHHGYNCTVCSFSFENQYGEIGKQYIHVHHIVPISEIRQEYVIDPVKDLVPVCPNCHAMIHRYKPALTIAELKSQLDHNG